MRDTGPCKSWSTDRSKMACFLLITYSYKSESINSARLNNIFSHDLLKLNGMRPCSFAMLFHRAPSQTGWRKLTLRWKAFGKRTAHSEHITSTLWQERLSLIFKDKLIRDWACVFSKWCCNGNKAGSLIALGGTDSPSHISCMLLSPPRYSVPLTFQPTEKPVGCASSLILPQRVVSDWLADDCGPLLVSLTECMVVFCSSKEANKTCSRSCLQLCPISLQLCFS